MISTSKSSVLQHTQLVTSVAFDKTGIYLLTGSADGALRIWNGKAASLISTFPGDKRIASVGYCPLESNLIASGDWNFVTKLWDINASKVLVTMGGHTGKVSSLSFRKDSKLLLTCSEDKSLRIWDFRNAKATAPITAPDEVLDCCFSPDGKTILAGCKNNVLLLWDVRDRTRPYVELCGHSDWVTCCGWSADGRTVISGSSDKTLKLWNPLNGDNIRTLAGHSEAVNDCAYCSEYPISCGGNRFWGSKENIAIVWSPTDEFSHQRVECHSDAIMSMSVSADNTQMATSSMDKTARIWKIESNFKEDKEPEEDNRRASTAVPMNRKPSVRRSKTSVSLGISNIGAKDRKVECRLGCGKSILKSMILEHELTECPDRMIICKYCSQSLSARELEAHEVRECPQKIYKCPCGSAIPMDQRSKHEKDICSLRKLQCILGCGMQILAGDMPAHTTSFCQDREVPCVLGCKSKLKAKWILKHQQSDCCERSISCVLCGAAFPAKDEVIHKKRYCSGKTVSCRLGCGFKMIARELQEHEENICPRRSVECSLGCGLSMAADEVSEHQMGPCPRRMIQCENGCGQRWPQESYQSHMQTCRPKRGSVSMEDLPLIQMDGGARGNGQGSCPTCKAGLTRCTSCSQMFCLRCNLRLGVPKTATTCFECCRLHTAKPKSRKAPTPMRFGLE